eukprot:scaffold201088_cov18-Tisochrysis_lutea.AAC.1
MHVSNIATRNSGMSLVHGGIWSDEQNLDALEQPYEKKDEGRADATSKCFYVYPHDEEFKKDPHALASFLTSQGSRAVESVCRGGGVCWALSSCPCTCWLMLAVHCTSALMCRASLLANCSIPGPALRLCMQKSPKMVLEISSLGFRLLRPETEAPLGLYSWGQIHSWAHAPNDFAFRHFDEGGEHRAPGGHMMPPTGLMLDWEWCRKEQHGPVQG